jgi:hypothetical protein
MLVCGHFLASSHLEHSLGQQMALKVREFQQISAAVNAHSRWITQLRIAIEDGTSEFDPDTVEKDNRCDFGKWLYDDFPTVVDNAATYDDIRACHAAFHRTAARILQLALNGSRDEALALMDSGGEFMGYSGDLIQKLRAFSDALAGTGGKSSANQTTSSTSNRGTVAVGTSSNPGTTAGGGANPGTGGTNGVGGND